MLKESVPGIIQHIFIILEHFQQKLNNRALTSSSYFFLLYTIKNKCPIGQLYCISFS